MNVCGIIAEFNPLHKGHAYLLEQARAVCGADHILLVMSGDYVQRGEPALMDKHTRAKMALQAGADVVLELPLPFSCGSAQYFARGAVAAMQHSAVCDTLFFATEQGGLPSAAEKNFSRPFPERPLPNDLLGGAYLEAIDHLHAAIAAQTIKRRGAAHDSCEAGEGSASASMLRKLILEGKTDAIDPYVPGFCLRAVREYDGSFLCAGDFSRELYYALLMQGKKEYEQIFDIYPDLAARIESLRGEYEGFEDFSFRLKNKSIRLSHVRRALLHLLLGLKKEEAEYACREAGYCPYLQILGFRRDAAALLHVIKKNADRPIITKPAAAQELLSAEALALFETQMRASQLYLSHKYQNGGSVSAYRRSPVIL